MGRGDLTNEQWARLEPLLPQGIKPGRPPVWTRRQLIDGIRWRTRTGAPWRDVPERYGPWERVYDLFRRWQRDGTWARIVTQLQAQADAKGLITWDVNIDSTVCRAHQHAAGAAKKGDLTGPNPVDRGKYGSKIHLITERTGLPISVGISGANLHDSQALIPLVKGIPPIRSRRGRRRRRPGKLHADKGYDYRHLRQWLSKRGIRHRIARKGIETSQRLGRHRWTIERTMSWLAGCHRLHRRYERKAEHFLAFTSIACTLICYRRLTK
ncbi:IS5 family transposase [Streptomyces prasinus]